MSSPSSSALFTSSTSDSDSSSTSISDSSSSSAATSSTRNSSESSVSSAWSESDANGWDSSSWSTSSDEKRDYEFGKRRLPRDFDFSEASWPAKKRRKFFKLIGMTRETFLDLCDEVKDLLPLGASTNGMSITPIERMLYFIKFFRKSEIGDNAAYSNDMSEGAVVENNKIVIDALNPRHGPNFCKRHIFLPDTPKAQWEAVQFMEMSGMPPLVIGAADGFQVEVRNISNIWCTN